MKKANKWKIVFYLTGVFMGVLIGLYFYPYLYLTPVKPSHILGFRPVDRDSSQFMVRVAQAELTRHLIPCGIDGIDGKCGKQTALGICELLIRIEKEGGVRWN